MKILKTLLVSVFFLITIGSYAQDLIIKTNSDTISCHIVKVAAKDVSYYPIGSDRNEAPLRISVKVIRKIIYENKQELSYVKGVTKQKFKETNSSSYYDNQHKNAIKFHALSILGGSLAFSYERSIKPGMSFEIGLGYIFGIADSSNNNTKDKGYIIRGGVKFMRPPSYYEKHRAYAHLLKGVYLKPEVIFNSFKRENNGLSTPTLKVWDYISSTSLVLNMGKQVVYSDRFLIDWYGFIGYGRSNFQNGYYYSNIILSPDVPISLGLGFRIGFVFL